MWKSFLKKDEGANLVEYSLILGMTAVAAIVIIASIGKFTDAGFREAKDSLILAGSGVSGGDAGGGTASNAGPPQSSHGNGQGNNGNGLGNGGGGGAGSGSQAGGGSTGPGSPGGQVEFGLE